MHARVRVLSPQLGNKHLEGIYFYSFIPCQKHCDLVKRGPASIAGLATNLILYFTLFTSLVWAILYLQNDLRGPWKLQSIIH